MSLWAFFSFGPTSCCMYAGKFCVVPLASFCGHCWCMILHFQCVPADTFHFAILKPHVFTTMLTQYEGYDSLTSKDSAKPDIVAGPCIKVKIILEKMYLVVLTYLCWWPLPALRWTKVQMFLAAWWNIDGWLTPRTNPADSRCSGKVCCQFSAAPRVP